MNSLAEFCKKHFPKAQYGPDDPEPEVVEPPKVERKVVEEVKKEEEPAQPPPSNEEFKARLAAMLAKGPTQPKKKQEDIAIP